MQGRLGVLRSKPGKRSHRLTGWPMRHCELPAWGMAKLDGLLAKAHLPGAARCQIDRPHRHLGREPEAIGGGGTTWDNDLATLRGDCFDRLFD